MCNPITTHHPEMLLAKGEAYGFEWEVTQNRMGYRCGYVRVPPGHPWHGKDYDSLDPYPEVHGGVTFAAPDTECGKGGDDNAWWVGFDCAHFGDAPDPELPGSEMILRSPIPDTGVVRTTEYVAFECVNLARQAGIAAAGM